MFYTHKSEDLFGNEIVQGMGDFLAQFPDQELTKEASKEEDSVESIPNSFAVLLDTISKVATKLDELGHPLAAKADHVLAFAGKEVMGVEASE